MEKDIERKESIENLMKIKFAELKIEKAFKDLESMNPLSMNIEHICKFPADLPIISDKKAAQGPTMLPPPGKEIAKLTQSSSKSQHPGAKQQQMPLLQDRELLKNNLEDLMKERLPKREAELLLKQLFTENIEQDSWLNNYKKPAKSVKQVSNHHQVYNYPSEKAERPYTYNQYNQALRDPAAFGNTATSKGRSMTLAGRSPVEG